MSHPNDGIHYLLNLAGEKIKKLENQLIDKEICIEEMQAVFQCEQKKFQLSAKFGKNMVEQQKTLVEEIAQLQAEIESLTHAGEGWKTENGELRDEIQALKAENLGVEL